MLVQLNCMQPLTVQPCFGSFIAFVILVFTSDSHKCTSFLFNFSNIYYCGCESVCAHCPACKLHILMPQFHNLQKSKVYQWVQYLFWDILYLHFQKEAPLEGLHESPCSMIIAHRIFSNSRCSLLHTTG